MLSEKGKAFRGVHIIKSESTIYPISLQVNKVVDPFHVELAINWINSDKSIGLVLNGDTVLTSS